jgi:hypothetical protein
MGVLFSVGFIIASFLFFPNLAASYQKGIALGLYSKEPGYDYGADLKEIKDAGATHVSLVVSWYQNNIRSQKIYPRWKTVGDYDTTSDAVLAGVIQQAHDLGLEVFLFPILRIENRQSKEWRGVVAPANKSLWLKNYRNFTMHYARFAAQHGVVLFSIGSELCSMEGEQVFWKKLIRDIRRFYQGKLLYSANWDHYQKITFWRDLDFLGLNAYYELTANAAPTMQELLTKWWDIQNEINSWQEKNHKPLIITEIGYPSIDGTCSKPWDYTREGNIDLEEQALCYEAFFRTWAPQGDSASHEPGNPKFAGVYFWNWYGQGGSDDRSYTPRGKPALEVLKKWYKSDL